MNAGIVAIIAASVFCTAVISGTFGMAGGMILMVVLLYILPLSAAISLHAAVQLVSNGWRCFLWRYHIVWRVLPFYVLGMIAGFTLVASTTFVPGKALVLIVMGAVPLLALIVQRFMTLTIMKKQHAFVAALCLTFIHMTGGVVGALLDLLYNNTGLTRHQIVATKAFTQAASHLLRLVYFGVLASWLTRQKQGIESFGIDVMVLFMLLAIAGTTSAAFILRRMNDLNFKRYSRYIIAAVSFYCLVRGFYMMYVE